MRWFGRALAWTSLVGLLVVPIGLFVIYAFAQRWFYPALWPAEWSTQAFERQLSNPQIHGAWWRSFVIAGSVAGLSLLVGYPAARALELRRVPGKRLIYALLFVPTVVPAVATGIGLNILFLRLGLNGTIFGVVLVHLVPVLPYAVLTLGGVFAAYDPSFEDQARVLGAGPWRTWIRVTLPLIFPGLVVTAFFAFLISWSQYLLTFLIGGGQVLTLPILLFAAASGGETSNIAVLALIFVAPLFVLIVLTARYLAGASARSETRVIT